MPTSTPSLSFEQIRNFAEKFSWLDPKTNARVTGFNPPANATGKQQVPYYIKYITSRGIVEQGEVVTLKVNVAGNHGKGSRQRLVKFTASNQCRWVRDYLIISIDGIRFYTH